MNQDNKEISVEYMKHLEGLVDDMDEIISILPYAKHALSAFKWAKKKRMISFLRSLNAATDEMDDGTKKRFNEIINSDDGSELLSEYVDSVLRTSSKTANAGLAILYADCDHKIFPREFKSVACYGLVGITEELVDYYLALFRLNDIPKDDEVGPYQIYFMNHDTMNLFIKSGYKKIEDYTHIIYVEELIRRKLLYPDYMPGRIVGEGFIVPFGMGSDSMQYCKLLNLARQYLR